MGAAKGITTNDFSYNNIGATSSRPFGGTSSSYEDRHLVPIMVVSHIVTRIDIHCGGLREMALQW